MLPFNTWQRCCPLSGGLGPLGGILARLDRPDARAELARAEAEERFPAELLAELDRLGLPALFADAPGPPCTTIHHLYGLNAGAAQASGSLAVTVGVTGLALLPIYLAGSDEQRARVRERVRGGARAAMLLSEWPHGSDLGASETTAEPGRLDRGRFDAGGAPTHYRISGEKQLINLGGRAELLMTLARTGAARAGGLAGAGLSLFLIERDATVEVPPRWRTLPVPAADIGGARFRATVVPASARVGEEGDGFRLVQGALTLSRGGIAAFASGTATRACGLAFGHARERSLYGRPIAHLAGVADNLARMAALDLAANCLSLTAASAANALGQRAAHQTAVAKLVACDLAERAVGEGRAVVSARALLLELPYQQVVRDVVLYGIFDGTRHLMVDQVAWRVRQMAAAGRRARGGGDDGGRADDARARREVHRAPPASLSVSARQRGRVCLSHPSDHAAHLGGMPGAVDLAPLSDGARALEAATAALPADGWADPGVAASLAWSWGLIDAALAVAELGDPARRVAQGLPELVAVDGGPLDPGELARLSVALLAVEALAGARAALAGAGIDLDAGSAERALALERARAARAVTDAVRVWS